LYINKFKKYNRLEMSKNQNLGDKTISENTAARVENVYYEWDKAWSNNDLDGMIALYAEDATLGSPLIPYMLDTDKGICEGRDEIRALLDKAAPRKPAKRNFHREGYFTDGKRLVWEYPRATPNGEQMDFFEVMDINENGKIKKHRVYWGWNGVEVIKADAYHN
jgi:ketosteroid isomerase-like protein